MDPHTDVTSSSAALSVHRLRFIPFTPSAPTSLALSPHPVGATGRSLLAVGRQNGNIDLCVWVDGADGAVSKGWVTHTSLVPSGQTSKKIESLAFAQTTSENYGPERLRLFSISGGSVLSEHFLPEEFAYPGKVFSHQRFTKSAKQVAGTTRTVSSHGGVIWCMAVSPLSRYIAIGCEDGHVRVVDIRDGRFELLALSNAAKAGVGEAVSQTDKVKSRIVSLAWGPPQEKPKAPKPQPFRRNAKATSDSDSSDSDSDDDDEDNWSETFLLAGTTLSVALLFALNTGRLIQKLLLPKARSEQTIVWSVAVLPDRTLVTGDSLGFVTFYDAATKVPLAEGRFQVHDKGADVLCLTVGPDGKTIYSGSVDQKVSEYALLGKRWAHTATRRLHAHDVKAVVIDPPCPPTKGKATLKDRVPILISASADFNVVLTPASPPSEVTIQTNLKNGKAAGGGGHRTERTMPSVESSLNPVSSNPITSFGSTTQRRIPYVPESNAGSALAGSGSGTLRLCSERGWLALRADSSIEIWEVQQQSTSPDQQLQVPAAGPSQNAAPYRQLLQMVMGKRRSKLISHAISHDGQYLAVSDLSETKLYSLRISLGELTPKSVKSFRALFGENGPPAASALAFTPDGRLVLASWPSGVVHVVMPNTQGSSELVKTWQTGNAVTGKRAVAGRAAMRVNGETNGSSQSQNGKDDDESSNSSDEDDSESDEGDDSDGASATKHRIDHLVITPDSQYLICSSANHIWTYNLDLLSPHPRLLPSLPSRPVGIACHPTETGVAAAALQDGSLRVLLWDEAAQGTGKAKWDILASGVGRKISQVRDHPSGISWITSSTHGPLLVVHGATWLLTARAATADLANDVRSGAVGKRRSRIRGGATADAEGDGTSMDEPGSPHWSVKLTFRYQPLVHVGPIKPAAAVAAEDNARNESSADASSYPALALVERPFFELAGNLEGAWKRERRYGQ